MLNDVFFKEVACRDVDYAKKYNPQVFKKIQTIIRYIEEKAPPYFGYCKAEFFSKTSTLFPGCWSFRLSQKHRFVFEFCKNKIIVYRAYDHYDDK